MAKKKYVVKGQIMGMKIGDVIAVDEQAVKDQNLETILEPAPKGAKLTNFDEGADVVDDEGEDDDTLEGGDGDDTIVGGQGGDPPLPKEPAATKPVPGGPPMPGKAVVTPTPGQ